MQRAFFSLSTLVDEERRAQVAGFSIPLNHGSEKPASGVGQDLDADTATQAFFDH